MAFKPQSNASITQEALTQGTPDFAGETVPSNEIIRSAHIESLKNLSGLTIGALLGALGLSTQRGWYEIVNKDDQMQPADKVVVASLVRWYLRHPEFLPNIQVDYAALYERINRLVPKEMSGKAGYETVFNRSYGTVLSYSKVGQNSDQDINQMCLMMQSMSDQHLIEFWEMAFNSNPTQIDEVNQWRSLTGKRPLHKRHS